MGLWLALPLLAAGLLLVAWAVWPLPAPLETIPLGRLDRLLPAHPQGSVAAGPNLSLLLRAPRVLRMGAQTQVTALLAPEGESTETGGLPSGYNLVAAARIHTGDLALDPNGEILEPLPAGGRASYTWRATPLHTGDLDATLFVRMELVPQQGGEVTSRTVLARALPMRSTSPLGLTQSTAVALGIAALLVSGVLVLGVWLGRGSARKAAP